MRSLVQWASGPDRIPSRWAASGFPIGAGEPDLVLVDFRPELREFRKFTARHIRVLACLAEGSEVSACSVHGLDDVGESQEAFDDLARIGAVVPGGAQGPSLLPAWQEVLTETVAIEAKVADWRRAVAQAARNRIFAARSFVALPLRVATRIAGDPLIEESGIGVLAVAPEGQVTLVREAPRQRPFIWFYYFNLALAVAASLGRSRRALRRSD